MAYYTVYRPKDWLDELRKSDDNGPIKVVFGSIHTRMPSIAPISVIQRAKKSLYALILKVSCWLKA